MYRAKKFRSASENTYWPWYSSRPGSLGRAVAIGLVAAAVGFA